MTKEMVLEKVVHRVFTAGIWIKGFDAVLEIIGGFIFLLASNLTLNRLVIALTEHELVEDPHDRIAIILRQAVLHISSDTRIFGSIYLIGHGLTKLWLVTGLLRGKRGLTQPLSVFCASLLPTSFITSAINIHLGYYY